MVEGRAKHVVYGNSLPIPPHLPFARWRLAYNWLWRRRAGLVRVQGLSMAGGGGESLSKSMVGACR